ncbi:TlpA family protein disulfide reductase [Halonatronum saccharophilum]|uniref:TlpA family protein disulfide reductase n=1 Tax=Halonatronum saccharophilum TaxID=150060 RepID=UPI0004B1A3A8|nr:TlpA disulfide reductase family protein [Halonatronum saccharophilum]
MVKKFWSNYKVYFLLIFFLGIVLVASLPIWSMSSQPLDEAEIEGEDELVVGVNLGKVAPDFTLLNLEGEEVSLSDYRGKNVLINFWASWCPPCREEMPDLIEFHNKYDDFVVLGVNIGEHRDTVREFIKGDNYTFPILLDEQREIARDYLVTVVPTSYFVGPDGKVDYIMRGMVTLSQLGQIRDNILNNDE